MSGERKIVWESKFDGGNIDPAKWVFDIGTGEGGWGNGELEFYTNRPENARVEGEKLIIEARKEDYEGKPFTSARMKTKGLMEFQYGLLEARIKLPPNQAGLWAAFWTLGANFDEVGWPGCGEIDVMEAGSAAAIAQNAANFFVSGATHWEGGGHGAAPGHNTGYDLSEFFRTYTLEWDEASIVAKIDEVEYYRVDNPGDAFRKPHFVLLNLAIGGNFPAITDPAQITAQFPAQMQVEYVRLFQKDGETLHV